MNPILKDFVKEELQKLLNVGFSYPISDSKWVSPLVVVPKKSTGKWRMCVDFRELNKETLKDYFPLPLHRPGFGYLGWQKILFFPGWV
jgi:hypothetical protein